MQNFKTSALCQLQDKSTKLADARKEELEKIAAQRMSLAQEAFKAAEQAWEERRNAQIEVEKENKSRDDACVHLW